MFESVQDWILAIEALLGGAFAVSLLIKGDQPDKFLEKAVNFIKKFSRK